MKKLMYAAGTILFTGVVWVGLRMTVLPHTVVDHQTVNVPDKGSYVSCYKPNAGNRKITAMIKSMNQMPLEVGIVKKHAVKQAAYLHGMLQRVSLDESYSPSLVDGDVEATTKERGSEACLILKNNDRQKSVTVKVTMKVYYRF